MATTSSDNNPIHFGVPRRSTLNVIVFFFSFKFWFSWNAFQFLTNKIEMCSIRSQILSMKPKTTIKLHWSVWLSWHSISHPSCQWTIVNLLDDMNCVFGVRCSMCSQIVNEYELCPMSIFISCAKSLKTDKTNCG